MAARLQTARGAYVLSAAGEPERSDAAVVLTLSLERADGLERVAFRCAIAKALLGQRAESADALLERLAPWVERKFEQLREAALKSVRSEGRLLQVEFETTDERR